jgi:oryzin
MSLICPDTPRLWLTSLQIHSVHQDAAIHVQAVLPLQEHFINSTDETGTFSLQSNAIATWGQARISHRDAGFGPYIYEESPTPTSATVYVIDTGIQVSHAQFNNPSTNTSRVRWGVNYVTGSPDTDESGHGTHVSGTVAGLSYGIAPTASLVAVKVLDANSTGTWTDMIAGVGWAVKDAQDRDATGTSIINMSAGGPFYKPMNDAVTAAVNDAGVTVVASAGNDGGLASNVSPAGCPEAVAVSASDWDDERPDWADYGPAVQFFAPGVIIQSAWIGESNQETANLTGTSMAAPHVSGLMANFVQLFGAHTPSEMQKRVNGFATLGVVRTPGNGTPNVLIFNGNSEFM